MKASRIIYLCLIFMLLLNCSCQNSIYNNWNDDLSGELEGGENEEVPMEEIPSSDIGSRGWVKYVDIYGDTIKYTTVRAADGRVWLQHNLGTTDVAQNAKDELSYGGVFQWGRPMDMHELRGSAAVQIAEAYTPSTLPVSLKGVSVKGSVPNLWWYKGEIDDEWTASSEESVTMKIGQDPCKLFGEDWSVPSYIEWMNVINKEIITNLSTAYNSNLKISAGGHRNGLNGNFYQVNNIAYYWTSTPATSTDPQVDTEGGARARAVWFWESQVTPYKRDRRSNGHSVRCIKKSDEPTKLPTVPGKVIAHSPSATKIYMTGPNIEVLPTGELIAMHDMSGPAGSDAREGNNSITRVYLSTDKGNTWEYQTYFPMHMSTLFQHNGALYTLGINNPSNIVINKSTDGGRTWSASTTLFTGNYHSASTPVLIAQGRIWKAVEFDNGAAWGKNFESLMISAPINSDLMNPSSWVKTNQLTFNASYLDGTFGGWLEGNAVVDKSGTVKNILRVHTDSKTKEYVAHQSVSNDGATISFDSSTDFHEFPGGSKKFFIRYDETTGKYITLANVVLDKYSNLVTTDKIRNVLTICSSDDLKKWNVGEVILETENYDKESFNYVSWQFDGNDIVLVSRTSFDDPYGGAANYHDSNYITFHRVVNYKNLIK